MNDKSRANSVLLGELFVKRAVRAFFCEYGGLLFL